MYPISKEIYIAETKPLIEKDPLERVFFLSSKISQDFLAISSNHSTSDNLITHKGSEISEEIPHTLRRLILNPPLPKEWERADCIKRDEQYKEK
jgi:hypothetical protein